MLAVVLLVVGAERHLDLGLRSSIVVIGGAFKVRLEEGVLEVVSGALVSASAGPRVRSLSVVSRNDVAAGGAAPDHVGADADL